MQRREDGYPAIAIGVVFSPSIPKLFDPSLELVLCGAVGTELLESTGVDEVEVVRVARRAVT